MKYFKYLLFVITALFSLNASAVCYHPANYEGLLYKPFPATLCYPEGGTGSGYCQFRVIDHGFDIQVPCTDPQGCGSTPKYAVSLQSISDKVYKNPDCTNPPLQEGCVQLPNGNIECEEEEEEEEENDPVLQCSTDSCPNPENKRCPTGYNPGSFNGQNICAKSKTPPDPDPEPCEGENCESDQDVINAVNDANYSITGAISDLNNSLRGILNQIKNVLYDISDTIADSSNDGDGDGDCQYGCGQGGETGEVDTSGLDAEAPFIESYESDNSQFETDLFESNSQCPADQVLNMSFMGSTIHYAFSYVEICDALHGLSFLVMIFSYLIAAFIVTRA